MFSYLMAARLPFRLSGFLFYAMLQVSNEITAGSSVKGWGFTGRTLMKTFQWRDYYDIK